MTTEAKSCEMAKISVSVNGGELKSSNSVTAETQGAFRSSKGSRTENSRALVLEVVNDRVRIEGLHEGLTRRWALALPLLPHLLKLLDGVASTGFGREYGFPRFPSGFATVSGVVRALEGERSFQYLGSSWFRCQTAMPKLN